MAPGCATALRGTHWAGRGEAEYRRLVPRSDPPAALTTVARRIDSLLDGLLAAERARWRQLDPALEEPLDDLSQLVLSGGKRIRPAYCYWGWVIAGGANSDLGGASGHPAGGHLSGGQPEAAGSERLVLAPVCAAGCALELLHAFALVHDDVMDASPTRRNAPSVWAKFVARHQQRNWHGETRRFGESAAVLVGDMAMVLADQTLGAVPAEARGVWDTLRTELNMGQYLDVAGTARGGVSAAEARTIIEHKTAGYTVVRPLQLGAALAGRPDLADALDRYGRPVGTAFQLRDDVLGAFGDPSATGKPVGDDLRENKPTLLMALARSAADEAQLAVLDTCGPAMDHTAMAAVQQVITDTGALAAIETEIDTLLGSALAAIEHLPEVLHAREALVDLARYVAARRT